MQAAIDRNDRERRLEAAARTAFERDADRQLTDAEWVGTRSKLLTFMRILRDWERNHDTSSAR